MTGNRIKYEIKEGGTKTVEKPKDKPKSEQKEAVKNAD